ATAGSPYTAIPTAAAAAPATIGAPGAATAAAAAPTKSYLAEPVSGKQLQRATSQTPHLYKQLTPGKHAPFETTVGALRTYAKAWEGLSTALPIDWRRIKSGLEPLAKDKGDGRAQRITQWCTTNQALARQLHGSIKLDPAAAGQQIAALWQWQPA